MVERLLAARHYVILAFGVLLAISLLGAARLSIDPNNRAFFSPEHVHYANLLELERTFGSNTNLVFLIEGDGGLADVPDMPGAIRWLTEEARGLSNVTSVESVATYPHVYGSETEFVVEDLLGYVCPEGSGCLGPRLKALDGPLLQNRLVGARHRSFAVVADVDLLSPAASVVSQVAADAKALKLEFSERFPSLSIYLTGGVPMMQAFFDAAQHDSETLAIVAVVVLAIGLYVFLGGYLPALLMLLLGASSVVFSLGVAGWAGYVVNTATATVPLIVLTLVLASAMHLFLHIVREEGVGAKDGLDRAIRSGLRSNWKPMALTAGTTVAGLLSMVFVSSPPVQELGLLSALGVAVGALLSVTVVPCVFACLPSLRTSNWLLVLQAAMNRYARWLETQHPNLLWFAVIFIVSLIGLGRASIDEDFVRYFSTDTDFRRDTEQITENLASPYHADIVYDSGSTSGIFEQQAIGELEDLVTFLRSHDGVISVASVLDVMKEASGAISNSSDLVGRDSSDLAQIFLSYELSLGVGQAATRFVDSSYRSTRISVLFSDVSMAELREFEQGVARWARGRGLEHKTTVTGEGIPTAYLSSESIAEVSLGVVVSVLVSAALIGLYFRGRDTFLPIFVAMVVPILAGFGLWSWLEPEVGMAATMVVAITIGVVVDDTIHLTYRFMDGASNLDLTPWGATAYSIHKTGTALVVTSIILVAGLLVLLGSEFRMNSTFGVCASLIIVLALLYNLTIAPWMLARVGRRLIAA